MDDIKKAFWKWMEDEKGYAKCSMGIWNKLCAYEVENDESSAVNIVPTKLMLFGYWVQFHVERNSYASIRTENFEKHLDNMVKEIL